TGRTQRTLCLFSFFARRRRQRIHPFIVANLPGGYKGRTAEKPPAAGRKNAPPPAGKAAPGRPPRQPLFCPLGPAGCKKSPGGFTKRKKDSTIEKQDRKSVSKGK